MTNLVKQNTYKIIKEHRTTIHRIAHDIALSLPPTPQMKDILLAIETAVILGIAAATKNRK